MWEGNHSSSELEYCVSFLVNTFVDYTLYCWSIVTFFVGLNIAAWVCFNTSFVLLADDFVQNFHPTLSGSVGLTVLHAVLDWVERVSICCELVIFMNFFITSLRSCYIFLQPNHLVGLRRSYIKLSFMNVNDLMKVKRYCSNREKYTAVTKRFIMQGFGALHMQSVLLLYI